MAWVTKELLDVWDSGSYVGENTPAAVVQVQLGHWVRGWYHDEDEDDSGRRFPPVNALIWGEGGYGPDNAQTGHWSAKWIANTPFYDVPNLYSIKRTRDLSANGIQVAEIQLDAVDFVPKIGALGDAYHAIAPGWLSPTRSYVAPGRARQPWQQPDELSEWAADGEDPRINDSVVIRIWQGYGAPQTDETGTPPRDGGTNGAWTFRGMIDDVDVDGEPNTITITARNGKLLTDQRVFRASKSVQLKDPVTFYDRQAAGEISVVGSGARASSQATGHPPANVLDRSSDDFNANAPEYKTTWRSAGDIDRTTLEWIEIRLPKGTYKDFWMASHPGMLAYVGIYAKPIVRTFMDENDWAPVTRVDPPTMDGEPLPTGWVDLGHLAPGAHGGWPYVRAFNTGTTLKPELASTTPDISGDWAEPATMLDRPGLNHTFELGEHSLLRVGLVRTADESAPAEVGDLHGLCARIQKEIRHEQFILVDDATEIIKVVLRWAGYRQWEIEDAMVRLSDGTNYGPGVVAKSSGRLTFNRANHLIDIVQELGKQLGWIFFIGDPTDADSEGVPTFRRDASLLKDVNISANITESTMLTGLKVKHTDEDRPYIIRVRGKTAATRYGGRPLGGDSVKRLMAVYLPPWAFGSRTGGILRHIVEQDDQYVTYAQCLYACLLTAMNAALQMHTAVAEIPANIMLELDDQVSVIDEPTGTNSRLWIVKTEDTMQLGKDASWKETLEGSLLDTRDLQEVVAQVLGDAPIAYGAFDHTYFLQSVNWRHVVNPYSGRVSGYMSPIGALRAPGRFTQKRVR